MKLITETNRAAASAAAGAVVLLLGGLGSIVHGADTSLFDTPRPTWADPNAPAYAAQPGKPWVENFLHWGRVDIHPQVAGGVLYNDNIRANGLNRQSDLIWTLTPSAVAALGDYQGSGNFVTLRYAPSLILFTDHSSNDSVDHDIGLRGQWRMAKLTLSLNQDFQDLSGDLVEVGSRVRRQLYSTSLGARYEYSEKLSFGLNTRQSISDYGTGFNGNNEWVVGATADYKITPKITLGLGSEAGWRDVRGGPNETFQNVQLRAGYAVTEKVSLSGSVGTEWRQHQGGLKDDPALIFSLGGSWSPREGTSIGFEAHRRNQTSITLANSAQSYVLTGFYGTVRQTVYRKYAVSLTGGYDNADYQANQPGAAASRHDEFFNVSPAVDCQFNDRWTASFFYLYRENVSSGVGANGFSNNQVGLRTGYRF